MCLCSRTWRPSTFHQTSEETKEWCLLMWLTLVNIYILNKCIYVTLRKSGHCPSLHAKVPFLLLEKKSFYCGNVEYLLKLTELSHFYLANLLLVDCKVHIFLGLHCNCFFSWGESMFSLQGISKGFSGVDIDRYFTSDRCFEVQRWKQWEKAFERSKC